MKLLALLILGLWLTPVQGQDSTTATYINNIVEKISTRIGTDHLVKADTVIYEEEGGSAEPLRISTTYHVDPATGKVDKIREQSRYRHWTTIIEIYYYHEKPIRLTSSKWNKTLVVLDFDVYYFHDSAVHFTRRDATGGKPDGHMFLKWSYDLLREYRAKGRR